MNIQIQIKVCRACLKPSDTTKLTEFAAESEVLKNFQFLLNSEPSLSVLLPKTFCEKCTAKIKLASNFKRQSLDSEDYLKNFVVKINQEFVKSISNLSANRKSTENENTDNAEDDTELEYLLQENEDQAEAKTEPPAPETSCKLETKLEQPTSSSSSISISTMKSPEKTILNKKLEKAKTPVKSPIQIEAPDLYSDESEQQIEEGNMFNDKEIYDIMEIEGSSDIYVDESGNAILGGEEDEYILVNYKSNDDLSSEKSHQFIVEEIYNEQQTEEKPLRKKHLKRMPREIIEQYAQSTDSNQHVCTKCVKVFSTRTNLIRHIQSHDGNKPYVCNVCSKGFTQSGSLKQHMYIHSGERPYKCQFCERAFTQGKTLKFHLRRHLDEKPFVCGECSATFRQRDGLKRHLKSRHNIELKFERSTQMDDKIIAYVNMDTEMKNESSQSSERNDVLDQEK